MFMVFDASSKVYVVLYYIDISAHQAPSACILGLFWRDHQTNMFSTCDAEATCTFTSKTSRKSNVFFFGTDICFFTWHGHVGEFDVLVCSGWIGWRSFTLIEYHCSIAHVLPPPWISFFRLRMSASLATVANYAACNHSSGIQILCGIHRGLKHVPKSVTRINNSSAWGLLKLCHLSIFPPFISWYRDVQTLYMMGWISYQLVYDCMILIVLVQQDCSLT